MRPNAGCSVYPFVTVFKGNESIGLGTGLVLQRGFREGLKREKKKLTDTGLWWFFQERGSFYKNLLDGCSLDSVLFGFFFWYWTLFDIAINQLLLQNYACRSCCTRAELPVFPFRVITTKGRKAPIRSFVELRGELCKRGEKKKGWMEILPRVKSNIL